MAKNEMKPNWEMTFMAEDIFNRSVAARIVASVGIVMPEQLKEMAESAIAAAKQWRETQLEHKFPDVIVHGNEEDDNKNV